MTGPPAHILRIGTDTACAPSVLLHGSDGAESDLMPLADELASEASKLGLRGSVVTRRWSPRLRATGALVTRHVLAVGHAITAEDGEIAREWIRALRL